MSCIIRLVCCIINETGSLSRDLRAAARHRCCALASPAALHRRGRGGRGKGAVARAGSRHIPAPPRHCTNAPPPPQRHSRRRRQSWLTRAPPPSPMPPRTQQQQQQQQQLSQSQLAGLERPGPQRSTEARPGRRVGCTPVWARSAPACCCGDGGARLKD